MPSLADFTTTTPELKFSVHTADETSLKPRFWSNGHDQEIAAGTFCNWLSYFQMTDPVNIAIYALGGFMLFALAIGFFAAPV
jgi:hypothetical protein